MVLNKPYLWLKGDPTTELMRLNFSISLGAGKKLSGPTVDDTSTPNTRVLTYDIIAGSHSIEYTHDLDRTTGFDPSTTDYITVIIRGPDSNGDPEQKSKGTSNTTEADSSGDGEDSLLRPFLKLLANA